jgi:1-acyl-sn-glycerol-3-phosphate acyltransferase
LHLLGTTWNKMCREYIYEDDLSDVISRYRKADILQCPPRCLWIFPEGTQGSWSDAIHFGGTKCMNSALRSPPKAGIVDHVVVIFIFCPEVAPKRVAFLRHIVKVSTPKSAQRTALLIGFRDFL